LLAVTTIGASAAANDITLFLSATPGSGELTLTWTGGAPPYAVHRGEQAGTVADAANRIAELSDTSLVVPVGAAPLEFFVVFGSTTEVDPDSPLWSTSDCLTTGTAARAAVFVELRNLQGESLPGATVDFATTAGTFSDTQSEGNLYWAELAPPAGRSGSAIVSVTADGVALATQIGITLAEPFTDLGGGVGGCPGDGNLRVRVVDEQGEPLPGAYVMVGDAEALDRFQSAPTGGPDSPNTGITDVDGYLEFRDFGSNLDGPQTITAAMDDRRYVTFVDVDAADAVLPLPPLYPAVETGAYTGGIAPVPASFGDPVEFAVMLSDLSLEALFDFSGQGLVADNECYSAGGFLGDIAIPANVYIPEQCASAVLTFCIQSLPEHDYTSAPVPFGDRQLLALRGQAPLSELTSGDLVALLASGITLTGIGATPDLLSTAGPHALDLPITDSLTANLSCAIADPPPNSEVTCVAAGDWDSASLSGAAPGDGRLFVMGYGVEDAAAFTGPFSIDGVTTVASFGTFADIDYLGAAVAQYLDPAKPGIPPGTVDGSTAIFERTVGAFDGSGGALTFDDFFPIRTMNRVDREFALSALPGSGHPAAHLVRTTIDQRVVESYSACTPDDSARVRRYTLWEVVVPGDHDAWQLPTPPVGWPRQAAGGDLAGLIDPAATPENDALAWQAETVHLGLFPAFDYDALRLTDVPRKVTHITTNAADY